jgi:hypothetical protein
MEQRSKKRLVIIAEVLTMASVIWAIDWTLEALSFTGSYMSFEGNAHIFISGITYGVAGGTRQYIGQTSIPLLLPFGIAIVLVAATIVLSLGSTSGAGS